MGGGMFARIALIIACMRLIVGHPITGVFPEDGFHPDMVGLESLQVDPKQAAHALLLPRDPIENFGVEIDGIHLIEGDIREREWTPPETVKPPFETATSLRHMPNSMEQTGYSHQTRNTVTPESKWQGKIIPYVLADGFNSSERKLVVDAMHELTEASGNCIRFITRQQNHSDFIFITGQLSGCWSDVGRLGGNQTVSVSRNSDCLTKGVIMHELLHALGFWHEHNRPDRNNHIQIIQENIRIDHLSDFSINRNAEILVPEYDYYSIMHYKTTQFSKNHQTLKTIVILKQDIVESEVGQRDYLSSNDKMRLQKLYECPTPSSVDESVPRGYNL